MPPAQIPTTADVMAAVKNFFRPEFYNRLDRVVVFQTLNADTVRRIAHKELVDIGQREGLLKRGLNLHYTPALIDFIVAQGFSPQYGARPLQRAIEAHVVTAISHFVLSTDAQRTTLLIDVDADNQLTVDTVLESIS